jgi:chromosome segregation ATPase
LNVLYDYGSVIGYSSRAGGVLHNKKGYVEVDEDSYHFVTFDAVPYPSVTSARPLNEGTEGETTQEKVEVSEEAHKKLLTIIDESGKKDKKVLKDFIYSLQDYNLDKEISVLEGLDIDDDANISETLKDTTLCLLKESYKQIHHLKSENTDVEKRLNESEKLNIDLKIKLDTAVKKINEISEGGKVSTEENTKLQESLKDVSEKNNILLNTIKEYEDSIDEAELKILEMEVLNEDIKKHKKELKDNKSVISELTEKVEAYARQIVKLEEELEGLRNFSDYEDVSGELGKAVNEITALKESYNYCVEDLNTKKDELSEVTAKLNESINMYDDLETEKTRLEQVVETYINDLNKSENKIDLLHETVSELNETVIGFETRINAYKNDLLTAVCGQYGVQPSTIVGKLDENFTLSDLHLICDSTNNDNSELDIVSVVEEVGEIVEEDTQQKNPKKSSRLDGMFTSNRRGNLK